LSGLVVVPGQGDLSLVAEYDGWRLVNADGDPLRPKTDERGVVEQLRGLILFHRLGSLSRSTHSSRLGLSLLESAVGELMYTGEVIELQLRSEQPVWLLLLYMDAAGGIKLLYPRGPGELRRLPAGERVKIPDDGSLRVLPPLGEDRFLAIGFQQRPQFIGPWMDRGELYPGANLFEAIEQALLERTATVATLSLRTVDRPGKVTRVMQ